LITNFTLKRPVYNQNFILRSIAVVYEGIRSAMDLAIPAIRHPLRDYGTAGDNRTQGGVFAWICDKKNPPNKSAEGGQVWGAK